MSVTEAGIVDVVTPAGVVRVRPALVRALDVQSDRMLYRAPFGSVWHTAGNPRRGVERYEVEAFVSNEAEEGIAFAGAPRDALQASFVAATELRSLTFGAVPVDGLESFVSTPAEGGFRVTATLIGAS